MIRLPPTLTGNRAVPGWAPPACPKPQPQKAIPLAAAPFKKLLRVSVIFGPSLAACS
jgi:hypothetical protein